MTHAFCVAARPCHVGTSPAIKVYSNCVPVLGFVNVSPIICTTYVLPVCLVVPYCNWKYCQLNEIESYVVGAIAIAPLWSAHTLDFAKIPATTDNTVSVKCLLN